jgi:hypothetical protein
LFPSRSGRGIQRDDGIPLAHGRIISLRLMIESSHLRLSTKRGDR